MSVVSKYVSLKNYIPTGLPKDTDFEIKSKEISINVEKKYFGFKFMDIS